MATLALMLAWLVILVGWVLPLTLSCKRRWRDHDDDCYFA